MTKLDPKKRSAFPFPGVAKSTGTRCPFHNPDLPEQDLRASELDGPASPARRRFLGNIGLAGGALAAGALTCPGTGLAGEQRAPRTAAEGERATQSNVAAAPESREINQSHPFYGVHQAGIVTPRPAAGLVAAFDVIARDRGDLQALFKLLTERTRFLMQGGPVPDIDPKFPPLDSGILGPVIPPDNLTMTLALGASIFDDRYGLTQAQPKTLTPMIEFTNDALDAECCHGDLLIQFCANTPDTTIHALRDIVKMTSDKMLLRWKQEGTVPVRDASHGSERETARNFLGFHDGTANPDARDDGAMDGIVWVGRGDGEPAWATGGTYQVVRIIRNFVERWDRTPLKEQEHIIGRRKASGAPLDGSVETDKPNYAVDPDGKITPLDAHIRLASPTGSGDARNAMLRRPFNYSNGLAKSGQLDMGLLFIAFQADLDQGFNAVQRRLDGEPLEEYIQPVGGGYFFAVPGVRDEADYFARSLLEATA